MRNKEPIMNVRECGTDDLDLIIRLGRETYYDTFHAQNSEETMKSYLDAAFNEEKIKNELKNPQSRFYIIENSSVPVAYLKINLYPAQSDINDPESLEIERIYVRKGQKGRGLGRLMIDHAVSVALERNCNYIWLGVWEKNSDALAFYGRMGFEVFSRHGFLMGDELQTDFILKKQVT